MNIFNCRRWKEVVEIPKFWTEMKLVVDDLNVSEVLQSRIIQLVSYIQFSGFASTQSTDEMLEQFFRAIVRCW